MKTHDIRYAPWFRGYFVTHRETGKRNFVHESRVMFSEWVTWPAELDEDAAAE